MSRRRQLVARVYHGWAREFGQWEIVVPGKAGTPEHWIADVLDTKKLRDPLATRIVLPEGERPVGWHPHREAA